jgi:hypothetical protein
MRWYQMGGRRGGLRVGLPAPVDPDPVDPDPYPDPGDPLVELRAALTPTNAELIDAMDIGLIRYEIAGNVGDGEGNPSTPYYPKYSYPIAAAAAFAGVATSFSSPRGNWAGAATAAVRVLAQIRYWINPSTAAPGGRAPLGRSGYHAQHEAACYATIAIAVRTPAIWDALTATEKERCDLVMMGGLVANLVVISDNSPYTGDWFSRRTIRGYTAGRNNAPNFSSPARLTPYVCTFYLEARGIDVQAWLNGFNQAAFAARCAPIGTTTTVDGTPIAGIGGLDELWKTFRRQWTNAVKQEEHGGVEGVGPGPTAAQILASINGGGSGTFRGLGRTLADHAAAFRIEIERIFGATNRPGLVGQVGAETGPGWTGSFGVKGTFTGGELRGVMGKAGWSTIPYPGQIGAFDEFDSVDGGEGGGPAVRSSVSYAFGGVGAVLCLILAAVVHQKISLNDTALAEGRGRVTRGWAYFLHATQHGYASYAKGAGGSSNNEDWGAAFAANNGARLTAASGLVRMLLAA